MTMNINSAEDRFLDYLEGRLSEAERGEFEKSLESSPELKRKLQEYLAVANLSDEISKQEHKLGADFTAGLMEQIERQSEIRVPQRAELRIWLRRLTLPLTVAATAIIAVFVSTTVMTQSTAGSRHVSQLNQPASAVGGAIQTAKAPAAKPVQQSSQPRQFELPAGQKQIDSKKPADAEKAPETVSDASEAETVSAPQAAIAPAPEAAAAPPSEMPASKDGFAAAGAEQDLAEVSPDNDLRKYSDELKALGGAKKSADKAQKELEQSAPEMAVTAEAPAKGDAVVFQDQAAGSSLSGFETAAKSRAKAAPRGSELAKLDMPIFRPGRVSGAAVRPEDYLRHNGIVPNTALEKNSQAGREPARKPAAAEVYSETEENQRTAVSAEPLSTFSLDVDSGSYTIARQYLSKGMLPPKFSVRAEEFVNYFDFDYPGGGVLPVSTGGPFSAYFEAGPSPLETDRTLLKIGIKTRPVAQSGGAWNLVFLVDTSSSMAEEDKLPLVKRSLKLLVNRMRPEDRISVVACSDSASAVLVSAGGAERAEIERVIDGLATGGGSNGADGIDRAYELAQKNFIQNGVNRVILITDGDFNVGNYSSAGLLELAGRKRAAGVSLTTVGFGFGSYNGSILERLASRGNGAYYFVDNFNEARRIFGDEIFKTIAVAAKDVKVQIEFNPEQVAAYRLIGYENRKLAAGEFDDDGGDAAEVGGGQTVTVLYELVLKGSELAQRLVSELGPTENSPEAGSVAPEVKDEIGFLQLRYKDPQSPETVPSKLIQFPMQRGLIKASVAEESADFRFASAVAYFAQLLRESRYAGSYKLGDIAKLAEGARGADKSGKREEFIGLVRNAVEISRR